MAADQERVKCQNCGKENRPGASFCSRCGTSFGESADPLLGKQVGTFVIEKHIGSGGSGSVYQGVHASLGKRVAIKVLRAELITDEETKARFDREAKVLATMEHPNIVSINDFGYVDGVGPYMVMEWLEGLTLFEGRKQRGYLNFPEIASIFEQLSDALSFMHARGIVHRDLKPENMMLLTPPGLSQAAPADLTHFRLKLYDFGIALFTKGDEKRLTAMGMVVGTPHYMAPEQIIVDAPVDHRADLYAIGSILFELLTGRPPFWGVKKPVQVMESHLRKKPPFLREVLPQREFPQALEDVVQRALAKNPADRYQDAMQLCHAVKQAIGITGSPVIQPQVLPLSADMEATVMGGSAPMIPRSAPPPVAPVQDDTEWANTQQLEAPPPSHFFTNQGGFGHAPAAPAAPAYPPQPIPQQPFQQTPYGAPTGYPPQMPHGGPATLVEGQGGRPPVVDPFAQFPTNDATNPNLPVGHNFGKKSQSKMNILLIVISIVVAVTAGVVVYFMTQS
jgi:serine/threonine protein kinase